MIKGNIVELIPATLDDRRHVYEWCFQSETTKSHSGPPDYPEISIPTYEEFCRQYYEEYFFTGVKPKDGRGFLIMHDGEAVGFVSYCSFHLKPEIAELDIWMNAEKRCGKGYGTDALISLGDYLNKEMGISELIIAPSHKNVRAVRSYKKAGFQQSDKVRGEYLRDEYLSLYGDGDYGAEETANLVKRYDYSNGDTYWYLTAVELVGFAGMIAGGVLMSAWGGFKSRAKTLVVGLVVNGMFSAMIGLSRGFVFYLSVMLVYGVTVPVVQTATTTLIQEKAEVSVQGRVFGLMGSMYSGFLPIGMAVFGPLADVIPLQWIMVASGVLLILIAIGGQGNRTFADG